MVEGRSRQIQTFRSVEQLLQVGRQAENENDAGRNDTSAEMNGVIAAASDPSGPTIPPGSSAAFSNNSFGSEISTADASVDTRTRAISVESTIEQGRADSTATHSAGTVSAIIRAKYEIYSILVPCGHFCLTSKAQELLSTSKGSCPFCKIAITSSNQLFLGNLCPICQQSMSSSTCSSALIPCGHTIHDDCLKDLLVAAGDARFAKCPCCTKNIMKSNQIQSVQDRPTLASIATNLVGRLIQSKKLAEVAIACANVERFLKLLDSKDWRLYNAAIQGLTYIMIPVFETLETFKNNARIQRTLLVLLSFLLFNCEKNKLALVEGNGIPALFAALDSADLKIKSHIYNIFGLLLTLGAAVSKAFVDMGGINRIATLMRENSTNAHLQSNGCLIFRRLASEATYHDQILKEGAMSLLSMAYETHRGHSKIGHDVKRFMVAILK